MPTALIVVIYILLVVTLLTAIAFLSGLNGLVAGIVSLLLGVITGFWYSKKDK